jgi:hypothetical protein
MRRAAGLFRTDEAPFEPGPGEELVQSLEAELGVTLPAAYLDLARSHNGGRLQRGTHPSPSPTSWAPDHVSITSIAAIGRTAPFSLCGEQGSSFWVREWGYPDIGVYFADCPSAGHDMVALDYRIAGEPAVVHVDADVGYRITPLAADFASFLDGLEDER